jgi:anaerobic magnesium-protoporphyrin IX monomethyl ester cyclase
MNILLYSPDNGCPYGCDFCTVTGFFGDIIRFRFNESVIAELQRVKNRAQTERGTVGVFFVDDNFAVDVRRTKSHNKRTSPPSSIDSCREVA